MLAIRGAHRSSQKKPGSLASPRRHRGAALACKRFAALCCDPELLGFIHVPLPRSALMPKARALCSWLMRRAAGHVLVLTIWLRLAGLGLARDDAAELVTSLAAAAAACAAAGPLKELNLDFAGIDLGGPLRVGSWAAGLTDLAELKVWTGSSMNLDASNTLEVTASLAPLQDLESLVRARQYAVHAAMCSAGL